jgi:hypothetical protein
MITDNVVLILGAGASKPYGYPTALELRKEIVNNYMMTYQDYCLRFGEINQIENEPYVAEIKSMIEIFKKSSTDSIDLFLTRNKQYYEHGKQIISLLLANYELESRFREDMDDRKYDWYTELFNMMTKEIINPEEINKFSDNKLSVITFNYDRSFEYYFYESLSHSFTSKRNEIKKIMTNFKIIHLNGKLAPLPWESNNGIYYKNQLMLQNCDEYSENINIIYDERKGNELEIKTLLNSANRIFFLGFGYGKENINALGMDETIFQQGQRIYGTAMGFTKKEIQKTISLLRAKNGHVLYERFIIEDCDSLMLLRNYL